MKSQLIWALPLFALVAGCSGSSKEADAPGDTASTRDDSKAGPAAESVAQAAGEAKGVTEQTSSAVFSKPQLPASVATGVAFAYNYKFRVPGERIETVQEEHAAACETLGPARCQITALQYHKSEEGNPSGHMGFLLDPAMARKFGSDAIASVEHAKGVMAESNVDGENVGDDIIASQVKSAGMNAELKRLEMRLRTKGLSDDEGIELRQRISEIRESLGDEREGRQANEKRLATTPVNFDYEDMGWGGTGAFGSALSASASSMGTFGAFVLMLAGALLPWLIPLGLMILLVKSPLGRGLRRWWRGNSPLNDQPARD